MSGRAPSWTVDELAAACGGRVVGDGKKVLTGIAPLDAAGPGEISFLSDPRWARRLEATGAGAVILKEEEAGAGYAQIIVEDPYLAYARVAGLIAGKLHPREALGVLPGAFVAGSAELGEGCSVYPGAYVGERARLGRDVTLHPGACVGAEVEIGEGTVLFPNAVVYPRCRIGRRVRVHACAVIGNDGYGFAPAPDGSLVKIPQLGWAEIGDDVEIGPCSTVHRGALGATRIGRGSKLDALVLVAHNVQVGQNVRLVGQAGVSGSAEIGDRAVLAGQAALAGHVKVGADVVLGARTGVAGDIEKPGVYWGTPAMPLEQARRVVMSMTRLPAMRKELKALARRLEKLESK